MPIKEKPEVEVRPERIYSERELQDFHQKIQRFYKPYTPQNPNNEFFSQTIQRFDYDEMAVAFGAFRKIEHGRNEEGKPIYLYASVADEFGDSARYKALDNLWRQYNSWRARNDAREEFREKKETERLEELAETVVF